VSNATSVIVRDGLGVFLALSAATKALDLNGSRAALAAHLGLRRARLLVPVLVALEAALAVAAIAGYGTRYVLFGVAGLFGLFAVVLIQWLLAGEQLSTCACFGLAIPSRVSPFTIGRNLALAGLALLVALKNPVGSPAGGLSATTFATFIPAILTLPLFVLNLAAFDTIWAHSRARLR
jgi:hypothetical protein